MLSVKLSVASVGSGQRGYQYRGQNITTISTTASRNQMRANRLGVPSFGCEKLTGSAKVIPFLTVNNIASGSVVCCSISTAKQKAPNYWASQNSAWLAHTCHIGVAAACRMVGNPRSSCSKEANYVRTRTSVCPPPAPCTQGSHSARPTLDAASVRTTAADATDSGTRRRSPDRAASKRGGGR